MIDKYNVLIEEVKFFTKQFEADESLELLRMKYYRGTQILLSPLVHRPKFMFIGINPGIGYFKTYNRNVKRYNPLQHFEYLHYKYQLATETKAVFKEAKLLSHLKDAVKTNCYFIATSRQTELDALLKLSNRNHSLDKKSKRWMNELINMVEPQIIICEGKGAFDHIIGNGDKIEEKKGVYSAVANGIPVIGYQRNRSQIKNKTDLSILIKKTFDSINQTEILEN